MICLMLELAIMYEERGLGNLKFFSVVVELGHGNDPSSCVVLFVFNFLPLRILFSISSFAAIFFLVLFNAPKNLTPQKYLGFFYPERKFN